MPWRKVLAWSGVAVAVAVVVVVGIYVVFGPVSDLIAKHDVGAATGPDRAAALQAARDAARGRLVAFGAGLFAAGALLYTGRNFVLSRRTFELTEQGQVTDRYTKAIEQLGSDKGFEVRIGGIYALERIARDSPRDHPTIMEVLAAFIREHSHEQWPPADDAAQPPARTMRPDVQAAATVIGRRTSRFDSQYDRQPINLIAADLAGADLFRADLTGVHLGGANLSGANLSAALLDRADLTRADLTRADLHFADLPDAHLTDADLTDADLHYTTLYRAYLTHANLTRANLAGARLLGAHLAGAHLAAADLTGADLTSVDFIDTDPPPARCSMSAL